MGVVEKNEEGEASMPAHSQSNPAQHPYGDVSKELVGGEPGSTSASISMPSMVSSSADKVLSDGPPTASAQRLLDAQLRHQLCHVIGLDAEVAARNLDLVSEGASGPDRVAWARVEELAMAHIVGEGATGDEEGVNVNSDEVTGGTVKAARAAGAADAPQGSATPQNTSTNNVAGTPASSGDAASGDAGAGDVVDGSQPEEQPSVEGLGSDAGSG